MPELTGRGGSAPTVTLVTGKSVQEQRYPLGYSSHHKECKTMDRRTYLLCRIGTIELPKPFPKEDPVPRTRVYPCN